MQLEQLFLQHDFTHRHLGPDDREQEAMLATLGLTSLEELNEDVVPADIRMSTPLSIADALTEQQALRQLADYAAQNDNFRSFIGQGYYGTQVPPVIQRNVLENPGWYTAYTPYQAEIAQGRLEALLNFQQMVMDLTGMPLANASLLDEATAAAEAMAMAKRANRKNRSMKFFVHDQVFPQTLDVLRTRAKGLGFELIVGPADTATEYEVFGALLQNPGREGQVADYTDLIARLHSNGSLVAMAVDLLSLMLVKSPGAMDADMVFGNSQRFGVPMGFGGPHAAFFACRDDYKRAMPGRIIGVSVDRREQPALRMALQTREQHIRREKANSNICTAQVLLANMAGFYAVYHGPERLRAIAERVHQLTHQLCRQLSDYGLSVKHDHFFDTLTVEVGDRLDAILDQAKKHQLNLRVDDDHTLGVSLDETTTPDDLATLTSVILGSEWRPDLGRTVDDGSLPQALRRKDRVLTHPVFNSHHSETAMLRYLSRLEKKDLALNHSMISLGSCTMKLNATAEMMPVSFPGFSELHPFAPPEQTRGYKALLDDLVADLKAITGFSAISLQPNSGAQGEYAGLVAIRAYQASTGNAHRDICLIPSSAHGTNPASAQMAGLKVVVTQCDDQGNVDLTDLAAKAEQYGDRLSCLMITYPSTHGVYEPGVRQACQLIHDHGGQVYMDGANLNAQVGLTSPAIIGADVAHMNLHKTFAIPHGGGGPGMGPIGVASHLAPYLPTHAVRPNHENPGQESAISAAPYGSSSILPISWAYIRMLGRDGVKRATEVALLNANYLASQLAEEFDILYRGRNGRVAHECIIDLRPLKAETGISEVDIAKRLMDYGFHAPTMSFPVPGTFMIEPTESENKAELDRFIEAFKAIRAEVALVAKGDWPSDNNPLVNAPHSQRDLLDDWQRPYSREQAAFPLSWVKDNKLWPAVNRIDDVYGDRNLFCSCVPIADYMDH